MELKTLFRQIDADDLNLFHGQPLLRVDKLCHLAPV